MKDRLLPLILMLLLAGLFTLLMQEFARRAIVTPLLAVFWIGRLVFESIPQIAVWWLFLFIVFLIAGRRLVQYRRARQPAQKPKKAEQGRIETWAKLLRDAEQETYYKWRLAQHLQELILTTLAHEERVSYQEMRDRLREERIAIPPELRAYLRTSMISFSHLLTPKSLFQPDSQSTPLDLKPEQIVQFLEEKIDPNRD